MGNVLLLGARKANGPHGNVTKVCGTSAEDLFDRMHKHDDRTVTTPARPDPQQLASMVLTSTKNAEGTLVIGRMEEYEHEEVLFCFDRTTGLRSIIAIHDTTLGPALGGTRMWPYATEAEALHDVLRLSRGMTYKSALAGLDLGGGKAVIIGDARTDKTEAMFRRFGRFVDSLNGQVHSQRTARVRVVLPWPVSIASYPFPMQRQCPLPTRCRRASGARAEVRSNQEGPRPSCIRRPCRRKRYSQERQRGVRCCWGFGITLPYAFAKRKNDRSVRTSPGPPNNGCRADWIRRCSKCA